MRNHIRVTLAIVAFALASAAWAQKPSAYPAKGQSADKQATDDSQCLAWAKQDTGIDPAVVASTQPVPAGPRGERARGAARGAVVGEIVSDDAGKGAAIGALAGGRRARINNAASVQQGKAAQSQQLDTYYRAYGACMQGRGYTVR